MITLRPTLNNSLRPLDSVRSEPRINETPGHYPESSSKSGFPSGKALRAEFLTLALAAFALLVLLWLCPATTVAASPSTGEAPTPAALDESHASPAPLEGDTEAQVDRTSSGDDKVESPWPPLDPCLPSLYRNWQEFYEQERSALKVAHYSGSAIVIDLSVFRLELCGILPNGTAEVVYETPIGAGSFSTPTPTGQYVINHVYSYPDVLFFADGNRKIPGLYNGFFAPLLRCDEKGNCARYREMGIHGFDSSGFPDRALIHVGTEGAVSSGCIRLPDPCRFKSLLIALAGAGPAKKNERGSFHWLRKPVDVFIVDNSPTILSFFESGLDALTGAVAGFLGGRQERN